MLTGLPEGRGNSLIAPLIAIRPIFLPDPGEDSWPASVNQSAPSGPAVMSLGQLEGVGRGYRSTVAAADVWLKSRLIAPMSKRALAWSMIVPRGACHTGGTLPARRSVALPHSPSAAARAANVRPPIVPVAVDSSPAAATAATPWWPRISTAAAAPVLGPI